MKKKIILCTLILVSSFIQIAEIVGQETVIDKNSIEEYNQRKSSNFQKRLSNFVEMSVSFGLSNDLESSGIYDTRNLPQSTIVESKSFARVKSYSIGIGGLLYKETGVKFSGGRAEYGFNYLGKLENSSTSNNDFYKMQYLEFYLGLIQKVPLKNSFKLLFDAGVYFHTGPRDKSRTLLLVSRNSRSFSGFAGIEMPMYGNNYFINVGLLFKTPLKPYNSTRFDLTEYNPYFIGFKIGMNFQF